VEDSLVEAVTHHLFITRTVRRGPPPPNRSGDWAW
jgi:hypothetical protein